MPPARLRGAFDVTPAISGRTGVARYVTEVGRALERRGVELRRFAVGRGRFPLPPETSHTRVPVRIVERWWRQVPWPHLERMIGDVDLVHATGLLTPRTRHPLVVTVHDVAAIRYPKLHPTRHVHQQWAQLKALHRASAVVTVSRTTAEDLVHLGVAPERLVVTPLGVSPMPDLAPPSVDEIPSAAYLLTVGETASRKNYRVVLRALARVEPDVGLVVAGPPAGDEQHLQSLIAELGLARCVTRLQAVSDSALAGLYRGALALCFPSIAEGFGLPVLEAMAAGVPVLASDIPATRELAGDAAIYVPAGDERAWADAIDVITTDARMRDTLAHAGRRRAAGFTWDRTATATLEAYRLALDAGR